ncbi:hypothetical protein MAR_012936 [Mya arenaria]|uniref:Uncharacterized protein n=1 Tax=Mya arenaria TaxID=6604 RepID=A0ABY7FYJ0_MYAAR|nr:hypothetical protein MAR_012936 [Mya arenaria]
MVPGMSEKVPGMSEMVPGMSEMGTGMSEKVPGMSEMVPGMSEMVPDMSELVPGMSKSVHSVTSRNHHNFHESSLISPTTSSHVVTERSDIFDSSQTFNRETAGSEIPKADALHGNTNSGLQQLVIAICVLTSLLVLVAIVGMVCLLRKLSEIHKDMITLSKSRRFNNTLTAAEDQANESVTNARTRRARYVRNLDDISPEGIQDGRNGDAYHFEHTRDQQLNEYGPQMDYFHSQNDPQHSRYSPEPWPQFSRTHRANTRSYGDHSQYMYSGGRDYNYGYRSNQANHNPLYNQGSHRTFSF